MKRREFLRHASAIALGLTAFPLSKALAGETPAVPKAFVGEDVFTRIVKKAADDNWKQLPIGELIGRIAMEFKGTPYVGFTLEISKDTERCVVNLNGLDCVTFFEDSLCLARMIKRGKSAPEDLVTEITLTRYRGGKVGDYTSRL